MPRGRPKKKVEPEQEQEQEVLEEREFVTICAWCGCALSADGMRDGPEFCNEGHRTAYEQAGL